LDIPDFNPKRRNELVNLMNDIKYPMLYQRAIVMGMNGKGKTTEN
jgi:hypothetical protein